ncbi:EAL domain-containing protein [Bordetella sp. FB-8]|uniref:EAL domain-containing response regulator n=1 Tax=Bordetella sp. FB-8 TaxID=1159870 RepID=UPI00037E1EA2|nr:EAL domain-containing response regulator [Bordetella sp. FB-8]
MYKSTIRILVLDDEAFMLKLLAQMLATLGFTQVTTCDNGSEALKWVDAYANVPGLIVMDLNMPKMDGVEFVRELVQHEYEGSLILVSGEDERVLQTAEKLIRAHQISVLGHLRKPVTPERLMALLATWVLPQQGTLLKLRQPYRVDEVRAAIQNGELVNYYQPKVALATGRVAGVETLVRWQHPENGIVLPDQFIGIAEEHGLINELTHVVLASALFQAKHWQQTGLALVVAVNISMDDLTFLDFPDFVAQLAASANVAPEHVVLEVTESRLVRDQRVPLDILTRLRLKRFQLSIDDFGTGHSSLAQLRDMPFGELKIDQSFVHGAWKNETLRAMVDASLGLGKQLGMEVVAEGVEDLDDWNFLRRTRCDLAQGYFIARPMPAADLPVWMESWRERMQRLQAETLS